MSVHNVLQAQKFTKKGLIKKVANTNCCEKRKEMFCFLLLKLDLLLKHFLRRSKSHKHKMSHKMLTISSDFLCKIIKQTNRKHKEILLIKKADYIFPLTVNLLRKLLLKCPTGQLS